MKCLHFSTSNQFSIRVGHQLNECILPGKIASPGPVVEVKSRKYSNLLFSGIDGKLPDHGIFDKQDSSISKSHIKIKTVRVRQHAESESMIL